MKKVFFGFIVIFSLPLWGQTPCLDTLRILYFQASYNPQKMDSLQLFCQKKEVNWNLLWAYQGATEVMKAKYSYNPISQFSYIKKGTTMLNQSISKENTNFEIHFLRFAVEHHLPSFLGLSTHLQTDKAFLLKNLVQIEQMKINVQFGNYLYDFLKISNRFTTEELKRVEEALKKYCIR